MRITLINFRCYTKSSFEFDDYQVTRIKSEPGEGKSTIFEAIRWVLHGGLNEVGHHLASKTRSTKVTLELNDLPGLGRGIIIYRQNHSNRLTLTVERPSSGGDRAEYEDSVAQSVIDLHFNSKKIWMSISYLRQGAQCVLLDGTKNDRFLLLQEIAARSDDPAGCISKIDDRLKDERQRFRDNQTKYETECNLLQRDLDATNIPEHLELTPENEQQLSDSIVKLEDQHRKELERETERQRLIGTIRQLRITIDRYHRQLNDELALTTKLLNIQVETNDEPDIVIKQIEHSIDQLKMKANDSCAQIFTLEQRLKEKQDSYDSLNHHIQYDLNGELMDLNRQYQIELNNNQRRTELKGIIEHLQRNIDQMGEKMETMPSIETRTNELNQEQRVESDLKQQCQLISESIMRSERTWKEKLENCQQRLKLKEDERKYHQNTVANLTAQINRLENSLTPSMNHIAQANAQIEQLTNDLDQLISEVESESRDLSPLPDESHWPTLLDVGRMKEIEKRRSQQEALANSMGITYDSNLPHEINKWKDILNVATSEKIALVERKFIVDIRDELVLAIRDLDAKLSPTGAKGGISPLEMDLRTDLSKWLEPDYLSEVTVVQDLEVYLQNSINQQRELIGRIKLMGDILSCPKCHETLRFADGKLVSASHEPIDMIDLDRLNNIIKLLSALLDHASKLTRVWLRGGKVLSPQTRGKLIGSSIVLSELSKTLETQILEKTTYIDQIETYLKAVSPIEWIEVDPTNDSERLRLLVSLREKLLSIDTKVKQLEQQKNQLSVHQSNVDNINEQLANYQTTGMESKNSLIIIHQELETLTSESVHLANGQNNDQELTSLRDQYVDLANRQSHLKIDEIRNSIRIHNELAENLKLGIEEANQHRSAHEALGVDKLPQIQANMEALKIKINRAADELKAISLVKLKEQVTELRLAIDGQTRNLTEVERAKERIFRCCEQIKIHNLDVKTKEAFIANMGEDNSSHIKLNIDHLNDERRLVQQGIRLVNWQTELVDKQNKLIDQQLSLSALEELRELAERVQYESLEETINSINNAMNYVFSKVFDDEIQVELKLFREIKSTKRITAQVNCVAYYKGAVYNRISSTSGGEKNRLNLGMILALNMVTSSPIIILDECTNFLNNRLREKCMAAVKALVRGRKTVLTVCHEDNDASYDQNVSIGKHGALDSSYPMVDGSESEGMMID